MLNALVPVKQITNNKKSFFEYEFSERYEAGIMLIGTEVKSCRNGMVQLVDAFAEIVGNFNLCVYECINGWTCILVYIFV